MNRFKLFGLPSDAQLTGRVLQQGISKPFELVYQPSPVPTHPAFGRIGGDPSLDITQGFGTGDHYLLETNASGDIVIEPGRNHRTFYLGGPGETNSYTIDDINTAEGINNASTSWIINNQIKYGGSPEFAIDSSLFRSLTQTFWQGSVTGAESVWFLLEGGKTHTNGGAIFLKSGQSALHPCVLGSYGTGLAIFDRALQDLSLNLKNWVFSAIHFTKGMALLGTKENFLMTGCQVTSHELGIQATGGNHVGHTLHNMKIMDVHKDAPANGGTDWTDAFADRTAGSFVSGILGFLVYNSYWDMNGWQRGYALDGSNIAAQNPSTLNHNLYESGENEDITLFKSIFMHASSSGAQLRSGHASRLTFFLENNIAHQWNGPEYGYGNYCATVHELVSGSGCRPQINGGGIDRYTTGPGAAGIDVVVEGLIIAHGADPNDSAEISTKTINPVTGQPNNGAGTDFSNGRFFSTEYVLYNWLNLPDERIADLDAATMEAATIQYWADAEQSLPLGTTDMEGVATYLRTLANPWDRSVSIWNHFAAAFGQYVYARSTPQIVRFVPNPKADGFRWDNPMNWNTGDWAGFLAGDGADLDGNTVTKYDSTALQSLDLGTAGALTLFGGKTSCDSLGGTGVISCQRAGQFWINGTNTGAKTVAVEGGRVVFDAQITDDISLAISGDAECVIHEGALLTIAADQSLTITGDAAWVGFDGIAGGTAELRLEGTTTFVPGDNGFSPIRTFQSGIHGVTEPNLATTVILGGEINVHLSSVAPGQYDLIDADQLTGTFDTETFTGGVGILSIIGGRLVLTVT